MEQGEGVVMIRVPDSGSRNGSHKNIDSTGLSARAVSLVKTEISQEVSVIERDQTVVDVPPAAVDEIGTPSFHSCTSLDRSGNDDAIEEVGTEEVTPSSEKTAVVERTSQVEHPG